MQLLRSQERRRSQHDIGPGVSGRWLVRLQRSDRRAVWKERERAVATPDFRMTFEAKTPVIKGAVIECRGMKLLQLVGSKLQLAVAFRALIAQKSMRSRKRPGTKTGRRLAW